MPGDELVVEFGSFRDVLDHFATRLSEEGVFLESTSNGGVGTEVPFQIRIRDGFPVLTGYGRIVRATESGVFLRLTYLDPPSVRLLPKLLEHYRRRGLPLLVLPAAEDPVRETPPSEPTAEAEPLDSEIEEPVLTLEDVEDELTEPVSEAEPPPDRGAGLLVEVGPSEAEDHSDGEESAEIRLNDLMTAAREVEAPEGRVAAASDLGTEARNDSSAGPVDLDPGLSWLPEEKDAKGKKELWIVVLLALLGVILGAALYFLVLRPRAEQSLLPTPETTPVPAAVPAALTKRDPATVDKDEYERSGAVAGVGEGGDDPPVSPTTAQQPATSERYTQDRGETLTGLERITWEGDGDATVITLWADGAFVESQVDEFRVDGGAPREVIRIRGIERPFAQSRIELGSEHVRQIRTGLHRDEQGPALHVVADLTDARVRLLKTESTGDRLRVFFSSPG